MWEVTQQLVKALWDDGSESGTSVLVCRLGGVGESARDLAYRLYAIWGRRARLRTPSGLTLWSRRGPESSVVPARRVCSSRSFGHEPSHQ